MKLTLLMAAVIIVAGCGIKGPPLPPLETVSDRANNANAEASPAAAASASGDVTKKASGDTTTIKKDNSK